MLDLVTQWKYHLKIMIPMIPTSLSRQCPRWNLNPHNLFRNDFTCYGSVAIKRDRVITWSINLYITNSLIHLTVNKCTNPRFEKYACLESLMELVSLLLKKRNSGRWRKLPRVQNIPLYKKLKKKKGSLCGRIIL